MFNYSKDNLESIAETLMYMKIVTDREHYYLI